MAQKIAQISGVGMVSIAGGQRQAVRIKVNPEALAANGLNLADVRSLIAASNVNQPKGNFDGPTRVSMLDANDQLVSPEQYAERIWPTATVHRCASKTSRKSSMAPKTNA